MLLKDGIVLSASLDRKKRKQLDWLRIKCYKPPYIYHTCKYEKQTEELTHRWVRPPTEKLARHYNPAFLTCQIDAHPQAEQSDSHVSHSSAVQQEPVGSVDPITQLSNSCFHMRRKLQQA